MCYGVSGGIEARSTFFPVDDSCPGHGTDCKRGLGELQNTQTRAQTTRPFTEDVVSSVFKKSKSLHKFAFPQCVNPPDRHVQYTSTQTHRRLVFGSFSVQKVCL